MMKTKTVFALILGGLLVLAACKKEKTQGPVNSGDNTEQTSNDEQQGDSGQPSGGEQDPVDADPFNGHAYVDLGLPSGNLWATFNIGAAEVGEIGDYFAWGEVAARDSFGWQNYSYGHRYNGLTKYCYDAEYGLNGYTDEYVTLLDEDDAVKVLWGGAWHMPTPDDFQELIDECAWSIEEIGEVGCLVTGPNDNSIFLPLSGYMDGTEVLADSYGYYLANKLNDVGPHGADGLWFSLLERGVTGLNRSLGYPIRPVASPQE